LGAAEEIQMKKHRSINQVVASLLFIAVGLIVSICTAQAGDLQKKYPKLKIGKVLLLEMDMAILPGTLSYLQDGLAAAESADFSLVLVKLSTPGGMLNTTQDIVKAIFNSKIPVVVYVSPDGASATSAGVFITLAAHVAVMAPASSIGSAHPVAGNGEDIGSDMRLKAENMASALIRSIAEKRQRNIKWAEKAVLKSVSVTASTAAKKKVVDFVAGDVRELLTKLKGRKVELKDNWYELPNYENAELEFFPQSLKSSVLNILSEPNILGIIWMIALTGIGVELYSPGLILPGVLGGVSLVLGLISMQILAVNVGAVFLLLIGLLLVVVDIFIGLGFIAPIGVICLIIGQFYLGTDNFVSDVRITFILFSFLLVSLFCYVFFFAKKRKPLATLTGKESLVGQEAIVETVLDDNEGFVFIEGETWKVSAPNKLLEGQKVVITAVNGLTLVVESSN
jgi:membrane-bound serine protease (ClpP class)